MLGAPTPFPDEPQYEWNNRQTTIATDGVALFFRPTFSIQNGAVIRSFLEGCWQSYRKLKRRRKLPEVINYIVDAEMTLQVEEVRLLLIFVALECLKSTYAITCGYPFKAGHFRKISDPPKSNVKKEPVLNFEMLLWEMFHEVKMKRGLKRAIRLRNDIVHYGLSKRPFESLSKTYDILQDMIREYILRLLNYKGTFLSYMNPGQPRNIK